MKKRRKAKVPRVLGSGCRPALLEAVAERSPRTVGDLATELKLSYMGVKSQCLALEKSGHLKSSRRRGLRGRPEVLYALTTKARELLPDADSAFSLALLEHSARLFGAPSPLKLLYQYFLDAGTKYQDALTTDLTPRQRIFTLLDLLHNDGHFVRLETNESHSLVESHNPLARILTAYPDAVPYQTDLLARLLGARLRREERPGGEVAYVFPAPIPEDPPWVPPHPARSRKSASMDELPLFAGGS
jgi:predicted ArsR family transcriptional regulator